MATEHALHRLVTQFMLDTCRYNTSTSDYAMTAFLCRCSFNKSLYLDHGDSEVFTCGSTAEFYITPMLPCVGDIDLAICFNHSIAIPSEQTPPTELEAHFQHTVMVFEIIDSHQPGYVYLQPSLYFLMKANNGSYVVKKRENTDNELGYHPKSNMAYLLQCFENCHLDMNSLYDIPSCMLQHFYREGTKDTIIEAKNAFKVFSHGPALAVAARRECMTANGHALDFGTMIDLDAVECVRCKVWPPQAADWPTRSRTHGWPDETTIRVVVNNGCDVVTAVHPSCRQDEWMNKHQWRLSFSRAEVTLLNSWTPVQQIVYHMLRFVMKHEILSKSDTQNPEVPTLCNYHIKTLMLWECEQTPPQSWWSADFSVVKHCSRLLHQLLGCVAGKRCQHYFISNCNLFSHFANATTTTSNSLKTVSQESFLLKWFVENYVWKCRHHGSIEMSLFDDTSYIWMLQRAVDDVIDKKYCTAKWEHYNELNTFQLYIHLSLYVHFDMFASSLLTSYAKRVKHDLQNIDMRLHEYFTAVLSLRIACKISKQSLTEDLLELMWTLYDPCNELNITCEPGRSLFMKKAIKLATLPGICCNALEMLHDEMAKAYLHQSFTPGDESGDFVVGLHVLLATLYYKSGFYVKTIVHCKQVLNKHRREQYASRSIGAKFLPRIDDSVDSVFGLMLLYQYLQENLTDMHNISQPVQKPAFTTDMLAHYLYSRCSAVPDTKSSKLSIYGQQLFQASRLLLGDVLLFKIMKPEPDKHTVPVVEMLKTDDTTGNSLSSMDTTLMVTLLELLALEKLSVVRQEMLRELYSEKFPVSNEFEVLHAYKCGLFEECFKICRSNVNLLLATGNKLHLQIYCTTFPELLYLLDGELVSLCGIIRLLQPICFLQILEFDSSRGICMLTLLLYLMIQCQRKMRCVLWDEAFEMIRVADQLMLSTDNDDYFFDRLVLKMTYRSLKLHADLRRAD